MEHTDHIPRARPDSRIAHAFSEWDTFRAFCGLEFQPGETGDTDRVTCPECLEELEKIRNLKT